MSLMGQGSTQKEFPVTVLLPGYEARAILPVLGIVQMYLNDDQKAVLSLKQVGLYGLEVDNPAASMAVPELIVRKEHCHAIAFDRALEHEETGLMQRTERIAVYTSHYAIQGDFHMGSDALVVDFIASSRAMFIGVTDAHIFPLFQPQSDVVQQAPLLYIYRSAVLMHHLV